MTRRHSLLLLATPYSVYRHLKALYIEYETIVARF